MRKALFYPLLASLLLFAPLISAQFWAPSPDSANAISFTLTGDIMQHQTQLDHACLPGGKYDFTSCFALIAPYLQEADYTIGNLELTLGGKPYRGYPCFSAPDTLLFSLRQAGFNVLTTANNHACDRRTPGVLRTIEQLDRANIPHAGTYASSAQRAKQSPLILEKNGLRVALMAYTYGTNGIDCTPPAIVNLIDTIVMAEDIAKAKRVADAIIVAIHWGVEYTHAPTREQKALCDFLLRHGVTLVVGNHPHVIQPFAQVVDDHGLLRQLAVYALGNFISAQRTFPRAGGMIVHLTLRKTTQGIILEQPQYMLTYVQSPRESPTGNFRILPLESPSSLLLAPPYARRYFWLAERVLRDSQAQISNYAATSPRALCPVPLDPRPLAPLPYAAPILPAGRILSPAQGDQRLSQ